MAKGFWEPTFSFFNPGDLSFSPDMTFGSWRIENGLCFIRFSVEGIPTFSTSSGPVTLQGPPIPGSQENTGTYNYHGFARIQGISGITSFISEYQPIGNSLIYFVAEGDNGDPSTPSPTYVDVVNFTSGNRIQIEGQMIYPLPDDTTNNI